MRWIYLILIVFSLMVVNLGRLAWAENTSQVDFSSEVGEVPQWSSERLVEGDKAKVKAFVDALLSEEPRRIPADDDSQAPPAVP